MSEKPDKRRPTFFDRLKLPLYTGLVDGLQAMIADGRLAKSDIHDDYQWLQQVLFDITGKTFCEACLTYDDCRCNQCTVCGEDNRFGEGYDGKCGPCADAAEIANELEAHQ